MSRPRRQHTIPEFLLRNFTDGSGCTYYFRKVESDASIIKVSPRNVFVERDRNSIIGPEGQIDSSLEEHFSQLEGLACDVILKLLDSIRSDQLPEINTNDRIVLNYFVYHQWTRVPDVMDGIVRNTPFEEMVEDTKKEVLAKGGTVSLREVKEILDDKERFLHNARVQTMAAKSEKIIPWIEARGLTIFHIRSPGLSFVLGSNPVLRSKGNTKNDLSDLSVEVSLPIAPDTALALHGGSPDKFRVHPLYDRQIVRAYNEAVFAQSTGTVSMSRQLLRSLAKRFNHRV